MYIYFPGGGGIRQGGRIDSPYAVFSKLVPPPAG